MIYNILKTISLSLGLAWVLAAPLAVQAQDPSVPATVMYLYRMPSQSGQQVDPGFTPREAFYAIGQQHPRSTIQAFRDLRDDGTFIVLIVGPDAETATPTGWSSQCFKQTSAAVTGSRCFVLSSSLLVGDPKLDFKGNSWIQIDHVDSVPTKRAANLPLFQKLEALLQQQPGFEGIQVWTWTARPNHWTVVTQWSDAAAKRRAAAVPQITQVWDQIAANTAAPSNAAVVQAINPF